MKLKKMFLMLLIIASSISLIVVFLYKNQLNNNSNNVIEDISTTNELRSNENSIDNLSVGSNFIQFEYNHFARNDENYLDDGNGISTRTMEFSIYHETTDNDQLDVGSDKEIYHSQEISPDYINWYYSDNPEEAHPFAQNFIQIGHNELFALNKDDETTNDDPNTLSDNLIMYISQDATSYNGDTYEKGQWRDFGELQRWDESFLNNTLDESEYEDFKANETYYISAETNGGDTSNPSNPIEKFVFGEKPDVSYETSIEKNLYDNDNIDYRNVVNSVYFKPYLTNSNVGWINNEYDYYYDNFKDFILKDGDSQDNDLLNGNFKYDKENLHKTETYNEITNEKEHTEQFENKIEENGKDVEFWQGKEFYYDEVQNISTDFVRIDFQYTHKFVGASTIISSSSIANTYNREFEYIFYSNNSESGGTGTISIPCPVLPSWYPTEGSGLPDNHSTLKLEDENQSINGNRTVILEFTEKMMQSNQYDENGMNIDIDFSSIYEYGKMFDITRISEDGNEEILKLATTTEEKKKDGYIFEEGTNGMAASSDSEHPWWVRPQYKINQKNGTKYNYKVNFLTKDFQDQKKAEGVKLGDYNDGVANGNPLTLSFDTKITSKGINNFEEGGIVIENQTLSSENDGTYSIKFYVKVRSNDDYVTHTPENLHMYLVDLNGEEGNYIDLKESGQLNYENTEQDSSDVTNENGLTYDINKEIFTIDGLILGKNYSLRSELDHGNNNTDYTIGFENSMEIGQFRYNGDSYLIDNSLSISHNQTSAAGVFEVYLDEYSPDLTKSDFEITINSFEDDDFEIVVPENNIEIGDETSTENSVKVTFTTMDTEYLTPSTDYLATVKYNNSQLTKEFTTDEWTDSPIPEILNFDVSNIDSNSAYFNYEISVPKSNDTHTQGETEINNIQIVDAINNSKIYVDLGIEPSQSDILIDNLMYSTEYSMQLKITYQDIGQNVEKELFSEPLDFKTEDRSEVKEPNVDFNINSSASNGTKISFDIDAFEGDEYYSPTIINEVRLLIDGEEVSKVFDENSLYCVVDYDNDDKTQGTIDVKNLLANNKYECSLIVDYNETLSLETEEKEFETEKLDLAVQPTLNVEESKLEILNSKWTYNFVIDNPTPPVTQEKATINQVKVGNRINPTYYGVLDNIDSSSSQITGVVELENIYFNSNYNFSVVIVWSDVSNNKLEQTFETDDYESTTDYNYNEPMLISAEVDKNNLSQIAAKIDYEFQIPDQDFGSAKIEVETIYLLNDGDILDEVDVKDESDLSGSLYAKNLEPNTEYSLTIDVTYSYSVPDYDLPGSGEVTTKEATSSYTVLPFTTFASAPIFESNMKLIEYKWSKNYIISEIYVIDGQSEFDLNKLKISATVDDSEIRTFNIELVSIEDNHGGIAGKFAYRLKLTGTNYGDTYSNWTLQYDDNPKENIELVDQNNEIIPELKILKYNLKQVLILSSISLIILIIVITISVFLTIFLVKRRSRKMKY